MSDPWTETFETHRDRLFNLAYRMLSQVQAAEDAVQDAYLRWRSVDPDTVENPGAYLTTIVTRLCLDELSSARAERETYTGPWLPEPVVEPMDRPDHATEQSDAVSMAMLVVLETLPPRQRAVYVLREAFEMPYAEIATVVDESKTYCRKLVQRARDRIEETDVRTDARPGEQAQLIDDFVSAIERGDAEAVAQTLAEDAVVTSDGGGKVTAARRPVEGRDHITRFLLGIADQVPDDLAVEVVLVNGRPGLLATVDGEPQSVWFFHVRNGHIQNAYAVLNPDKLAHIPVAEGRAGEK
jgi:RNA polymerase sigma-70 factor (ECF subfamily)